MTSQYEYETIISQLKLKIVGLELFNKQLMNYSQNLTNEFNLHISTNCQLKPNPINQETLCTNVYCGYGKRTFCKNIHYGHKNYNSLYNAWINERRKNKYFWVKPCINAKPHNPMICRYSHTADCSISDRLDKALPTSRENDYSDLLINSDSIHDPTVTKEQLDSELDEYCAGR